MYEPSTAYAVKFYGSAFVAVLQGLLRATAEPGALQAPRTLQCSCCNCCCSCLAAALNCCSCKPRSTPDKLRWQHPMLSYCAEQLSSHLERQAMSLKIEGRPAAGAAKFKLARQWLIRILVSTCCLTTCRRQSLPVCNKSRLASAVEYWQRALPLVTCHECSSQR
jgi:hypothetical protein